MQCAEFDKLLPALVSGAIQQPMRAVCETHMQDCARCLEAFAMASAAQFIVPDADVLVQRVVQATTPELCTSVADQLCDLIDAALVAEQAVFLTAHLRNCSQCRQLYLNLQALNLELALLGELRPPERLLARILRNTSHRSASQISIPDMLLQRGRQILLRPRFALEAAFVVTLFWTALFGVPASILSTAVAEQTAVVDRLELRKFWSATQADLGRELTELGPEFSRTAARMNIFPSGFLQDGASRIQRSATALWLDLEAWVDSQKAGFINSNAIE